MRLRWLNTRILLVFTLLFCQLITTSATNLSLIQRPEDDELFQLVSQVQRLQKEKNEKSAIPLVERAVALAEKTVPHNDPRYIAVLVTSGEVYWHTGYPQKAEP